MKYYIVTVSRSFGLLRRTLHIIAAPRVILLAPAHCYQICERQQRQRWIRIVQINLHGHWPSVRSERLRGKALYIVHI